MRVLPSGTTALLVELDDPVHVLGVYESLTAARPRGVVDVVPAERTVLVVIDPSVTDLATVGASVRRTPLKPATARRGETVTVRVTYDGEDLADVARLLGCEPRLLVQQHTAAEWRVAFCGFAPGFAYLTSSDVAWDVPRRGSPRTRVPAGTVALAGRYSGVYPSESPGGWQLIGRTSERLFDVHREPPALLAPGTRVRFVDECAS